MPSVAETVEVASRDALRVVLISDRQDVLGVCAQQMALAGFKVTAIGYSDSAIEVLRRDKPPLTVVDVSLPAANGLEILKAVRSERLGTAVIAVSGDGSLKRAVTAMKLGAFDYLPEPFDNDRLILAMYAALGRQAPPLPLAARATAASIDEFQGFIALSHDMREVYHSIERAGAAAENVFITGERGIGRDVCARAVHACSSRRHQPFITVHCAAIPKALVGSELFGHVEGAFVGAVADWAGLVTQAHGGTLFLDEICDLETAVQARLLQLAEHGTFQRLGGSRLEQVDVRIIGAASRAPGQAVNGDGLQAELFERLSPVTIDLPLLRRRSNDILQIGKRFLFGKSLGESRKTEMSVPALTADGDASGRSGDIRELQNTLRNAVAADDGQLRDTPTETKTARQQPADESSEIAGREAQKKVG